MYQKHFNLERMPFSLTPNPRFIYLSPQHREALAHLLYGLDSTGGFVVLTGEVGTGKTTLCRCLLELLPEDVDIALITNPRQNSRELLASICDKLKISHPGGKSSIKLLVDLLTFYLQDAHARGRRTVLLLDEAQNLSHDALEQVRLLTNLETNESKLLQIMLVGQPELNGILGRKNLRQMSQRVTARYHLMPLNLSDTRGYIKHRLAVSGTTTTLFGSFCTWRIYQLSQGIPRLINALCDRSLLGAYAKGKKRVTFPILLKAAREALPVALNKPFWRQRMIIPATVGLLVLTAGFAYFRYGWQLAPEFISRQLAAFTFDHEVARDPAPSSLPVAVESSPGGGAPSAKSIAASAGPAPDLPAQAEPAPSIDFPKLIASAENAQSKAFSDLFALWKINGAEALQDACQTAQRNGLRCLQHNGSWVQLLKLDYPAVLEFELPDGSKRYGTLTGEDKEKLELAFSGKSRKVSPADILPFWKGAATLLWKPPLTATLIVPGEVGAPVVWLRQRLGLTIINGAPPLFDEELRKRVIAFQMENGLLPDGRVGPQTMIHLEKSQKASDLPRLSVN